MSDERVALSDVRKSHPGAGPDGGPLPVLKGLSLTVKEGESVAVTGPSGSGKSTLLNIIGTLDRPDSGSVLLNGVDLGDSSDDELADIRLRSIGFVFQLHHLLPQCAVLENVLLPTLPKNAGSDPATVRGRAMELLERLNLKDRIHHRPAALSGGERQRVAVARALINQPSILLADEPTGSLDRRSADELADMLLEFNQRDGLTLLMVTHSERLADRLGRRLKLVDGALVAA